MTAAVRAIAATGPWLILVGPARITCHSGTSHVARRTNHAGGARCVSGGPAFPDEHICLSSPAPNASLGHRTAPTSTRAFALSPLAGVWATLPSPPGGTARPSSDTVTSRKPSMILLIPVSSLLSLLGRLLSYSRTSMMVTPASVCRSGWVHVLSPSQIP